MKYIGENSLTSLLKFLLSIFLCFGLISFFINAITIIRSIISFNGVPTLSNILSIIIFLPILVIIYELRKVLQTFKVLTPFIPENVTRFRIIGIYAFIKGILDLVYNLITYNIHGFYIFRLEENGMSSRMGILLYICLGLFALILSEIFKLAVDLKQEKDLSLKETNSTRH